MKIQEIDTPALVVDLNVMETNIREMAKAVAEFGVNLRPHIKTHKVPAIASRQIETGAGGITVAKLGEAEVMAAAGLKDIFTAYEIVGAAKLQRLIHLAHKIRIACGVDSVETAEALSSGLEEAGGGVELDVILEVDTGLGRCGVKPGKDAVKLAERISCLRGLNLRGIFTHEGHVYAARSMDEIKRVTLRAAQDMVETVEIFRKSGLGCDVVSMGSTPSAEIAAGVEGVTEIRPGTYIYNDLNQVALKRLPLERCAAHILTTVVSRPDFGRAVVDAGSKALSLDQGVPGTHPGYGQIVNNDSINVHKLNEEHGYLTLGEQDHTLNVGDRLEIIPNHICVAVNNFDKTYGTRGDMVEVVWPTEARGKIS